MEGIDMDQLLDDLRSKVGAEELPNEFTRSSARSKLLAEISQQQNGKARLPKRLVAGGLVAACLAGVLAVTPVVQRSFDNNDSVSHTALGVLFAQAAEASESQPTSTSDYWFTRVRQERNWADNGTKYGVWSGKSRVEVVDTWFGKDGTTKMGDRRSPKPGEMSSEGTVPEDVYVESARQWREAIALPESLSQLRKKLRAEAEGQYGSLQGDVASVDKAAFERQMQAQGIVTSLQIRPISAKVRANMYRILGELADQNALTDKGVMVDAVGRNGHAFSSSFSAAEGDGESLYVFDPTNGAFLESQFIFNGKIFDRDTQLLSGFVPNDTAIPE